jgi:hypothetical protein
MLNTPYSTWNPEWSPTEHEIFRDFGFVAFEAQMLESSLVTILLVAEDAGRIEIKKSKKKSNLEFEFFLSEKTMGQLFHILKEDGVNDELMELIDDALEARNYLMHHFYTWNTSKYATEEGRGEMLKELQRLRFRIGRTQQVFSQIREHIVEEVYGYSTTDVQSLYDKLKAGLEDGDLP